MFLANNFNEFWTELVEDLKNLDFTTWPFGLGEWFVVACAALLLLIIIIIVGCALGRGKEKYQLQSMPDVIPAPEPVEVPEEKKDTFFEEETSDEDAGDELTEDDEVVEEDTVEETPTEVVDETAEEVDVEEEPTEEKENDDKTPDLDSLVFETEAEETNEETEAEEVIEEETPAEAVEESEVVEEETVEEVESEEVEETEVVEEETVEEVESEEVLVEEEVIEDAEVIEVTDEVQEDINLEQVVENKKNNRYQGKYEIFQDGDSFRFRLKASNGEPLVISELYRSEESARKGIDTVKRNLDTGKLDIVSDKHDLWRFELSSSKGRRLVNSASYRSEKRCQTAFESFKRFAYNDNIIVVDGISSQVEVEAYDDGGQFELSKNGKYLIVNSDNKYAYVLRANNGHVICQSQTYASKASCLTALENFRETVYTGTFYISKDKNSRFQFKLYINRPKRCVMVGQVYETKEAVVNVIESIKRFAKEAIIIEE